MELTFHSTGELIEFLDFCSTVGSRAIAPVKLDASASVIGEPTRTAPIEIEAPESDRDLSGHPVAEAAAAEPAKRKRRTKAEMEAARVAESGETPAANAAAGQPDGSVMTTVDAATSQSTPAGANPFAQQTLPEGQESAGAPAAATVAAPEAKATPADVGDLQAFIAARTAERPALDNIEHLNMARGFIAKHGMPKYNETFALAGLSANIMAFTPADCARHAAVLDFLASE